MTALHTIGIHQGGELFPGAASSSGNEWYSTPVWAPWAKYIEWQVNLEVPQGVPTSGLISAVFEVYVSDYLTNASQEIVANVKWASFSFDDQPEMLPDGNWPLALMQYNGGAAVTLQRRIATKFPHRLHLTSTLAGGSTPGCPLSVRHIASEG